MAIQVNDAEKVIYISCIQKGDKGDPGADGAPGVNGTDGVDGVDGLDGFFNVGDTAPLDPQEGDGWFNSLTGQSFIYYDGFWVEQLGNPPVETFNLPNEIHTATAKTTLDSADEFGFWDSISSGLRKITWSNFKSLLDSLYASLTHASRHSATGADPISVSSSQVGDASKTPVGDKVVMWSPKDYANPIWLTGLPTEYAGLNGDILTAVIPAGQRPAWSLVDALIISVEVMSYIPDGETAPVSAWFIRIISDPITFYEWRGPTYEYLEQVEEGPELVTSWTQTVGTTATVPTINGLVATLASHPIPTGTKTLATTSNADGSIALADVTGFGAAGAEIAAAAAHTGTGSTRKLMGLDVTDSPTFAGATIIGTILAGFVDRSIYTYHTTNGIVGVTSGVALQANGVLRLSAVAHTIGVTTCMIPSDGVFCWGNDANIGYQTSLDTALARNAPGVAEVNSGTAGTFRDLKLRNLISTGSIQTATYTVATTPATAALGMVTGAIILVSDAEEPAIGSAVASGAGTDHLVTCQYNGTNWIVTAILT